MSITLLLGGVRAGKSARALDWAREREREQGQSSHVLFVATAQAFDDEMRVRIAAHQRERATHWQTLEEPLRLAERVRERCEAANPPSVVIIDCLTLWVSNLLLRDENAADTELAMRGQAERLIACMNTHSGCTTPSGPVERHWILVSNEVGLGVVPPTPLGRLYRDALGRVNQDVAAAASRVSLMVAGLELRLK